MIVSSAQDIQAAPRQHCAMQAQMDFIPLGRGGHNCGGSICNDYIRGSDDDRIGDDDEQDDHDRRIAFAPRLKNIRQRILAKLGMAVKYRKLGKSLELYIYICF